MFVDSLTPEDNNFNSIKVRLNQIKNIVDFDSKSKFQFHKGTIKPEIKQMRSDLMVISIP